MTDPDLQQHLGHTGQAPPLEERCQAVRAGLLDILGVRLRNDGAAVGGEVDAPCG